MAKRRARRTNAGGDGARPENVPGARELIVVARDDALLRATPEGVASLAGADVRPLTRAVERSQGTLRRLFATTEEALITERLELEATAAAPVPDLSVYYYVDAPDERLDDLAAELAETETVEAAYVKPPGEPPIAPPARGARARRADAPDSGAAPAATPDFVARQIYLQSAPAGIDAQFAWTRPGGRGSGVNVIDLEWGWRFNHEDLRAIQGGVVGGVNSSDDDHGTAVIGEISGDRNGYGVVGICPDAHISAVAFSMPTAQAIRMAADRLRPGDIMLLEIHRAGPRHNFQPRLDQRGYVAIEWWPDDFDAIRYAVSRGIIVVEAAGNGAEDLDDPIYEIRPGGFPQSWRNPFNRSNRDSGAIVVGAGAPPPGTHGQNHGADRSRLSFSNYGALIDAQGWGREVTTTGYGDLQGQPDPDRDRWYTDHFSGTSSASPIVVGAIGCVQGILRQQGGRLLTPATTRDLLRSTGSPQQDTPGRPATQRIGNRPDLRQMIGRVASGGTQQPTVRLIALDCHRTEDWFGPDEAYLNVNGRRVWGPVSLNNGQSADLTRLRPIAFRRRARIDLYDEDNGGWDPDDHLGTGYAWAGTPGEQSLQFRGHGAAYTLTFEVNG